MPGRQGHSALRAAPSLLPPSSAVPSAALPGSSEVFITQMKFPEHLLLPASVLGCCSEQNRHGPAPLVTESHQRCHDRVKCCEESVLKALEPVLSPVGVGDSMREAMLELRSEHLWELTRQGGRNRLACAKTCPHPERSMGHLGTSRFSGTGTRGQGRVCCKMSWRGKQGL